jgi:hypothetical protein
MFLADWLVYSEEKNQFKSIALNYIFPCFNESGNIWTQHFKNIFWQNVKSSSRPSASLNPSTNENSPWYKPELSIIRSCPNRLEFKNECYSTVNSQSALLFLFFFLNYISIFLFLSILLSPYKPELSMIRSCPNRLEFQNECYSTKEKRLLKSLALKYIFSLSQSV